VPRIWIGVRNDFRCKDFVEDITLFVHLLVLTLLSD
jgi:hypothetical protein